MPAQRRSGLTLIESLIVMAIIAVSIALLIPAVWLVRSAADTRACANNLRQLGMACHHSQISHGRLPPALNWFPDFTVAGGAGIGPLFFHLLPFVEQDNLYQESHWHSSSPPMDYFDYHQIGDRHVPLYSCPADPSSGPGGGSPSVKPYAGSSYAANFLVFGQVDAQFGYLNGQGRASLGTTFPDGTSYTILFGEKFANLTSGIAQPPSVGGCHWAYWGKPEFTAFFALDISGHSNPNAVGPVSAGDNRDSRFQVQPKPLHVNPFLCSTGHPNGMNVAMADASVHALAPVIDRFTWWALVTPAAGDQAQLNEF